MTLDPPIRECAVALGKELRYDRGRGRVALGVHAHKRFGKELFARTKKGFGLPARYFRGQGLAALRGHATSRSLRERGWLDLGEVARVFRDYDAGRLGPDAVWMLGMLELWARVFVGGRGARPGPELFLEAARA